MHPKHIRTFIFLEEMTRLRALCLLECVCAVYGGVSLGTWGRWNTLGYGSVLTDCHLLISCHGELVRPSLLEVCPSGPAALPRWACEGFVCRGLKVFVCVSVRVCTSYVHCVCMCHCDSLTLTHGSPLLLLTPCGHFNLHFFLLSGRTPN